ncbi:nucleotidyltransferase domain-containing protein [Thauera sp. ZXT1-4]|uniref:nucleotidyltransferase domain-containing protein n=1 Tax=Thauera sp. ZXT1-4 TaxID=3460294 RepID=UPI004040A78E
MRLTQQQIASIKQTAHAVLGDDARVILFGSRVDDAKKGGDIDLLFETDQRVKNRSAAVGAIYVALIRQLGDRKIDILLKDSAPPSPCAGHCTTNRYPAMSLKYQPEHTQPVGTASYPPSRALPAYEAPQARARG